jgi:hypothetical protein
MTNLGKEQRLRGLPETEHLKLTGARVETVNLNQRLMGRVPTALQLLREAVQRVLLAMTRRSQLKESL